MGDVVHDIQTCHTLLVQVIHRVRIFFAKNGHQHVRAGHFFFAIACGLHMHDGTLNHALETQRRLRVYLFSAGYLRGVVFDEIAQ